MPTSIPTIRATTTIAVDRPCTSWSVAASTAALTGASASPKPKPQRTSGMFDDGVLEGVEVPGAHQDEADGRIAIPTAVTTPAGSGCG